MPPSQSDRRSALDRMIDRLTTQRTVLGWAVDRLGQRSGLAMEVGLGKGRTYDHLRRLVAARDVLVFDRWKRVPRALEPDADRLFLGDFRETLPAAARRFPRTVRLVHADIGSAREEDEDGIRRWLPLLLDPFLMPGAIVLSDRPIGRDRWTPLAVPGTERWAYFAWRTP